MTKTTKIIIGILALVAVAYTVIVLSPDGGMAKYKQDESELNLIRGQQTMQIAGLRKPLHNSIYEEDKIDTILFEFDLAYEIYVDDVTSLMGHDENDYPALMGTEIKPRKITMTLRGYDMR